MITKRISGLAFKVHSPSLFELADTYEDTVIACVALCLVGRLWYIDILMKKGHSHHRGPFPSRDAAAAMLANRQQERAS